MESRQNHGWSRWDRSSAWTLVLAAAVFAFAPAAHADEDYDKYFSEDEYNWGVCPAAGGGIAKMGSGYTGYTDLGKAGVDLYFIPPLPEVEEPNWVNRMAFRVSVDYFPLQVPDGVYGLSEDLYAGYASVVYRIFSFQTAENRQWVPFLSAGGGIYVDRLTLDSPASGKVSGSHRYFGWNGGAGFMFPSIFHVRLAPEVRYHMLRTPGKFAATHTAYQVNAILWFGGKTAK